MPESLNQVPALLAVDDADIIQSPFEEEISISSEIRPTPLTYRRCLELSSRDFVVGSNVFAIVNDGVFVDQEAVVPWGVLLQIPNGFAANGSLPVRIVC